MGRFVVDCIIPIWDILELENFFKLMEKDQMRKIIILAFLVFSIQQCAFHFAKIDPQKVFLVAKVKAESVDWRGKLNAGIVLIAVKGPNGEVYESGRLNDGEYGTYYFWENAQPGKYSLMKAGVHTGDPMGALAEWDTDLAKVSQVDAISNRINYLGEYEIVAGKTVKVSGTRSKSGEKMLLDLIIENYPESEWASIAKTQLEQLKK